MNKDTLARQVGNYFLSLCYVPRMKKVYSDPKGKHHVIGEKPSKFGRIAPVHTKLGLLPMSKDDDRMRHVKDWQEFKRYFSDNTKLGKANRFALICCFEAIFYRNMHIK